MKIFGHLIFYPKKTYTCSFTGLVFFTLLMVLNASTVRAQYTSYNCSDGSCSDYGDNAQSFSDSHSGNIEQNGADYLTSAWVLDDDYILLPTWTYAGHEFQNFINNTIQPTVPNAKRVNGYETGAICVSPKIGKTKVSALVHTTTNDMGKWRAVDAFREPRKSGEGIVIRDLTTSPSSKVSGVLTIKNSNYTINAWEGYLLPGHVYEVTFDFTYKRRLKWINPTTNPTQKNRFYICVSGFGGPGGNGTQPPAPDVTSVNCASKQLNIDFSEKPKLEGFEFFWSLEPYPLNDANALTGEAFDYSSFNEDFKVYVQGKVTLGTETYITPVTSYEVSIAELLVPVYTGNYFICSCDPNSFNISYQEPGENQTLIWYGYNSEGEAVQINDKDGDLNISQDDWHSYNNNVGVSILDLKTGCITPIYDVPEIEYKECGCTENFSPNAGEKYVVSAWVKQGVDINLPTYTAPTLKINFSGSNNPSLELKSSGPIVNGWQQIRAAFTIPSTTAQIEIELLNKGTQDVWFDDIRFQPFNSSMVAYVYDQETMQLVAELDDENFKTEYVYDADGNLIRTNIETTDGVRTVAESRSHVQVR